MSAPSIPTLLAGLHALLERVGRAELLASGIEYLPVPYPLDGKHPQIGGESFLLCKAAHNEHPINSFAGVVTPRGGEGPFTNEALFVSVLMLSRLLWPGSSYPKSQKNQFTVRISCRLLLRVCH